MVRAYSKSEDAYIAASILGSSGIEAVVIDENSIGGNLMGTTQKAAIRVEVEESHLDEAKDLLQAAESQAEENRAEVFATVPVAARRSLLFDVLVLSELGCVLVFRFFPNLFFPELDGEFQAVLWKMHLFSSEVYETGWMLYGLLYDGYVFLTLLAAALLLLRIRLGRILFTFLTVYILVMNLFLSAAVSSPLGSFFSAFSWMLSGAVCFYCWAPATKGEFRKRRS